ncbi:DUF3501 family protein [Marinobacterium jannaschii]|uniref:DUF3501 family protein n=1 Tax=Marinobacterium jannaschii TaxID=64970 RepID=UPI0004810AE9|nr:DUF3501 family protein [Marinobacterium jannaschii]
MKHLSVNDLWSLEEYARCRGEFRRQMIAHKERRQIRLGEHLRLMFEDRLTMQYQVQEMLRAERIFEPDGIQEELDTYNPLIPDGDNWKATLLIEYTDIKQRRKALKRLQGIERHLWFQLEGQARVYAIADEDMPRDSAEKTSSVHFLRFQLDPAACRALRLGQELSFGVDHPHYEYCVTLESGMRAVLLNDLEIPDVH